MHITRKKPIRTSLCFKGQSLLKYFPICKTLQYVSYFHHTVNFVSLLVYEKTSKQNSWFLLFQVSGWIIILLCWRRCNFLFGWSRGFILLVSLSEKTTKQNGGQFKMRSLMNFHFQYLLDVNKSHIKIHCWPILMCLVLPVNTNSQAGHQLFHFTVFP